MIRSFALCVFLAAALAASADHGAPTTRPVAPPEEIPAVAGESAPVELSADGYKVKLSWYPAAPKAGDLVRFRAEVVSPGGAASSMVVKAGVTRTGPGGSSVLLPRVKADLDSPSVPGVYTWQTVFFTDGIYQVDIGLDDLTMGKSAAVSHTMTLGQPPSNMLMYGILIGGLAAIAVVLAFGLRRPAAATEPA